MSFRASELDEAPPPTWTAVLASWVIAACFAPIATVIYVFDVVSDFAEARLYPDGRRQR